MSTTTKEQTIQEYYSELMGKPVYSSYDILKHLGYKDESINREMIIELYESYGFKYDNHYFTHIKDFPVDEFNKKLSILILKHM